MKVAEYVAQWIAGVNPRVYGVCGAGAMHLNDAICNHPGIKFTAMHHEQAATFAAEADARVSGKPGIVHVTAGPGGTNTVTGIACAYVDSIPLIVIAGQVTSDTMRKSNLLSPALRQHGVSELPMAAIVTPITKYAATVPHPQRIAAILDYALCLATSGRKGSVFVEIPLDVQNAEIDPEKLDRFVPIADQDNVEDEHIAACVRMLNEASKPVLMIGNGIRLSGAVDEINALVDALQIPVISGWSGSDLIDNDHPCYIGRAGLHGDRASNFAVQNADLILAIGTRLSVPQTGHHPHLFAPNAKKIVVDIDYAEANKQTIKADLPICADAKAFIQALFTQTSVNSVRFCYDHGSSERVGWLKQCQAWKAEFPVILPEYRQTTDGINSYVFLEELAKHLDDDAIIVTDVGFAFVGTMQGMKLKKGQRLMHSSGVAPMGWGLPAAIGACMAGEKKRQVVCICGDGGIMFNLQELQTIAHHKLPISIFVMNNGGYRTMQFTQDNHFHRRSVSDHDSGVSCPDFEQLQYAFDISCRDFCNIGQVAEWFDRTKGMALGPWLHVLHMSPTQFLAPRVHSRMVDGKFVPTPIDHMWPPIEDREAAE